MATASTGEELGDQPQHAPGGDDPGLAGNPTREPFVGNVSMCTPLPPYHSGPVRKGLLRFDACFETGNRT